MSAIISDDVRIALELYAAGKTWPEIGAQLGKPWTTLRGRAKREGAYTPRRAARIAAAKVAAAKLSPSSTIAAAVAASTPNATTPPPVETPAKPVIEVVETTSEVKPHAFLKPSWYDALKHGMLHEKGAMIFGPRGSGKSTAIRHLSNEVGVKYSTLQCATNMQIDSLIGTWTSESGTLKHIDGPLAHAVRNDEWMLAEEANAIAPGVWSMVNTLTDNTGEGLRLPTGEIIPQRGNFRLVLLFNEGYAGTKEVNAALRDRLMPIYADYLTPAQEEAILIQQAGVSAEAAKAMVGVAKMIRAANLGFDLSPRALLRWARLVIHSNFSWHKAFEIALVDLIGGPQTEAARRNVLMEICRNTATNWKFAAK